MQSHRAYYICTYIRLKTPEAGRPPTRCAVLPGECHNAVRTRRGYIWHGHLPEAARVQVGRANIARCVPTGRAGGAPYTLRCAELHSQRARGGAAAARALERAVAAGGRRSCRESAIDIRCAAPSGPFRREDPAPHAGRPSMAPFCICRVCPWLSFDMTMIRRNMRDKSSQWVQRSHCTTARPSRYGGLLIQATFE